MGAFLCRSPSCGAAFKSRHSGAMYCSRSCAAKVNVPHQKRVSRYTDEQLLSMLTGLADELGQTPSQRQAAKTFGYTGWSDRFGTYRRACELAGLAPNHPLPGSFVEDRTVVGFSLRFRILERDGFRCTYCGGTPSEGYVLHVDHVIPRSLGGKTTEENLVAACFVCNEGKSNRVFIDG